MILSDLIRPALVVLALCLFLFLIVKMSCKSQRMAAEGNTESGEALFIITVAASITLVAVLFSA